MLPPVSWAPPDDNAAKLVVELTPRSANHSMLLPVVTFAAATGLKIPKVSSVPLALDLGTSIVMPLPFTPNRIQQ